MLLTIFTTITMMYTHSHSKNEQNIHTSPCYHYKTRCIIYHVEKKVALQWYEHQNMLCVKSARGPCMARVLTSGRGRGERRGSQSASQPTSQPRARNSRCGGVVVLGEGKGGGASLNWVELSARESLWELETGKPSSIMMTEDLNKRLMLYIALLVLKCCICCCGSIYFFLFFSLRYALSSDILLVIVLFIILLYVTRIRNHILYSSFFLYHVTSLFFFFSPIYSFTNEFRL